MIAISTEGCRSFLLIYKNAKSYVIIRCMDDDMAMDSFQSKQLIKTRRWAYPIIDAMRKASF